MKSKGSLCLLSPRLFCCRPLTIAFAAVVGASSFSAVGGAGAVSSCGTSLSIDDMCRGRRAAAADRDERTCDEIPTAAGAERKADTPQKDAGDPNTATAATALSSFAVLFVLDEGLAFTCCSRLAVVISQYLWSGKIRHFLDEFLQVEKTQSYWSKRNNYREQCERAIGQ